MTPDTISRPSFEKDYYLWALDQARRLRAMAHLRANEPIDWELLAEEVEDLGNSQRIACESLLEQIIAHLLKLAYSQLREPRGHWRGEVAGFRSKLRKKLSPTLDKRLREGLAAHYAEGRDLAVQALIEDEPDFPARLPLICPWSYYELTGGWWPERAEG